MASWVSVSKTDTPRSLHLTPGYLTQLTSLHDRYIRILWRRSIHPRTARSIYDQNDDLTRYGQPPRPTPKPNPLIILGDLPKDHPTTGSHPVPPRPTDPNAPPPPPVTDDPAYPRAVEDRMRVSDFATRLRQAEIAQRKEDEAKDRALANSDGGRSGGVQAVSGPGELLKRRAERETERRPGVSEMERNEEIARDVERHIEVRDRTEKKI